LVAGAAAKNLVPCILELGGKSPMIVDRNADLLFAAKQAALYGFINCGQLCVRCDFLLVHDSIFNQFTELLRE